MLDMSQMSDAEKKKLGLAVGLLVVALGLIYWFGFRSSGPDTTPIADQAAPLTATEGGPPPAANRRLPPGAKK